MRPPVRVLLLAVGVALLPGPASASCAAPSVQVTGTASAVQVTGATFVAGCQDVCECSGAPGCERCDCGPPPSPVRSVVVRLVGPGGEVLAEQPAAVTDGAFAVGLPPAPGAATVLAVGTALDGTPVRAGGPLPAP